MIRIFVEGRDKQFLEKYLREDTLNYIYWISNLRKTVNVVVKTWLFSMLIVMRMEVAML